MSQAMSPAATAALGGGGERRTGSTATFVTPEAAWHFVRRQSRIILATTAVALVLGAAVAAMSPARFRSAAQLLVDPRGLQILKNEITRSSDSTDGALVDIENQRYVILSRSILEAAVKGANLADSPLFGAAPPGLLGRLTAILHGPPKAEDRRERAIDALGKAVEVVRGERAYILDVVVNTRDPQVSADIANTIARVYLERETIAKAQAAQRAGSALTDRANGLRHEVEAAEQEVETFRTRNNLAIGTSGQLLTDQQINDLNYQLALARTRTADVQARVEQIDAAKKTRLDPANLPEALQSATILALKSQYAQLVQQEAALSLQLGARHPALVGVEGQLKNVRVLIDREIERLVASTRGEYARAKANEAALVVRMDDLRRLNDANTPALVHLRELERAAEAKRSIYQAVASRAKEIEEQQGLDTSNTRIISDAVPASRSSGPPLALVLAGSLILGLGVGAGLGHLRERLGRGLRSQADLSAFCGGVPVLGTFRGQVVREDADPDDLMPVAADREVLQTIADRLCETRVRPQRLVAFVGLHDDPIRAQLLPQLSAVARRGGHRLRLVTCPAPGRAAMTRSAQVVGITRPRSEDAVAITDLVAGSTDAMTPRRLRETLERFANGSDVTLVDTPPLADVGMPSALLKTVDAVVLILAAGDLDTKALTTLLSIVDEAGVPKLGIILTGATKLVA